MILFDKIKKSESDIVSDRVVAMVKSVALKDITVDNSTKRKYGSYEVKKLNKPLYNFVQDKLLEILGTNNISEFNKIEDSKFEQDVITVLWNFVLIH